MKRVFYKTIMYDYATEKEALKHCVEMIAKGWKVKQELYKNGGDYMPYTIEYEGGIGCC